MAAFSIFGFAVNVVFFKAPLLALWTILDIPIIALLLVGFFHQDRRVQVITIALYGPLLIVDIWVSL